MKRLRLDDEDLFELRERPVKPRVVEPPPPPPPAPKPPYTKLQTPKATRPLATYPPDAKLGDKRNYYVSAYTPGTRNVRLLAGPFQHHANALANVEQVRKVAWKEDKHAHHHSYGTVATKRSYDFPGEYNKQVGLPAEIKRARL